MSNQPPEQEQLPQDIAEEIGERLRPYLDIDKIKRRIQRPLDPCGPMKGSDGHTMLPQEFIGNLIQQISRDIAAARPAEGGQAETYKLLLRQLAEQKRLVDSSAGNCPLCRWGGADTHRSDCPFMLAAELASSSSTPRPERCENHCIHSPALMKEGACTAFVGESISAGVSRCGHRCAFSRVEQSQSAIRNLLGFLKITPLKLNEADTETYSMLVSAVESELKGE